MAGTLDIMRQVVKQELPKRADGLLGVVTATYPRTSASDVNNLEVDVRLKNEDLDLRRVPVGVPYPGFAAPPRVDELVLVQFVCGQVNQPVVTSRYFHADDKAPLAQENEILLEHRVPDGTLNHLRFQADGTILLQRDVSKPQDGSAAKTTLRVDGASGDITIAVGSDVLLELKDGGPVKLTCSQLAITGDVEITGGLKVTKGASGPSTTISGNEITGA